MVSSQNNALWTYRNKFQNDSILTFRPTSHLKYGVVASLNLGTVGPIEHYSDGLKPLCVLSAVQFPRSFDQCWPKTMLLTRDYWFIDNVPHFSVVCCCESYQCHINDTLLLGWIMVGFQTGAKSLLQPTMPLLYKVYIRLATLICRYLKKARLFVVKRLTIRKHVSKLLILY